MTNSTIPTVVLSPFFCEGNEEGKKKARKMLSQGCSEYGVFQVVNHGVPLGLLSRAMDTSKTFFAYPAEEKHKISPDPVALFPAGYNYSRDKLKEDFFMCSPTTTYNVFPSDPPEFRNVMEELFANFSNLGQLVEGILNDCLGLPPNFLKNYNHDRDADLLAVFKYLPATKVGDLGNAPHRDASSITLLFQDEVGGLEFQKNGEWLPVTPTEGAIVVNVGDVIQVLTNNKIMSATHRVVSPKGRTRLSLAYNYNLGGNTWVEPLSQFTQESGPKYRRYLQKEYVALRLKQKAHPPSRNEDRISIDYYAISAQDFGCSSLALENDERVQVLTNKKIMSGIHRVVSPKGRNRLSFVYSYNLEGNTWVEPLSQFTQGTGPKYRGYLQKDYVALRLKQKAHPPSRNEDRITVDYYAISALE
ncbi:hypothetical protein RJ640_005332 [Escallonia rubra]|uniref:Fe2OG dioxygenase domain-containing protein n=1 Tax=Escallonia rubra TaxID=112253 RepID=A0AA88QJV8_9ASTE|nr:hypothetical protein RJ640_005332 [Escallonia rubra]